MKRLIAALLIGLLLAGAAGAMGEAQDKTLVVYFSATGTTKRLAEFAGDILGADIYEIVPQEPYTEADLAYYTGGRADREQEDKTCRPAIAGEQPDIAGYGTVVLGYPIWHGQAPRIMSTFVENNDFDGITVIPFCTSGGSGIQKAEKSLREHCPAADWKPGKLLNGGNIEAWVKEMQ